MSQAQAVKQARQTPARSIRSDDGTQYRIRVTKAKAPGRTGDNEFDLIRASVPVFLWRSLPVLLRHEQRLNLIERFALQAAQELGWVTAAELATLTGLPQRAVGPLLRRLLASGVLRASETDSYVLTSKAALALQEDTVTVVEESIQDFAYFPTSDELLALNVARTVRNRLFHPRLRPILQMPVPPPRSDQPPSAIVNRHLDAGTVLGRTPALFRAVEPEHEDPIGELCPAFEARPVLCDYDEEHERHLVELTLRAPAAGQEADHAAGDPSAVKTQLVGVSGLVGSWKHLADLAKHPAVLPLIWLALADSDGGLEQAELAKLSVEEIRSARYAIWLPEAAVLKLRLRAGPLGYEEWLRLEDDQATVLIRLELRPADHAAAALFALDDAARLLDGDSSAGYGDAIATAARRFELPPGSGLEPSPEQVRARMWQLKYYQAVYARRGSDDFDYA